MQHVTFAFYSCCIHCAAALHATTTMYNMHFPHTETLMCTIYNYYTKLIVMTIIFMLLARSGIQTCRDYSFRATCYIAYYIHVEDFVWESASIIMHTLWKVECV